jgi:hypothetical protein
MALDPDNVRTGLSGFANQHGQTCRRRERRERLPVDIFRQDRSENGFAGLVGSGHSGLPSNPAQSLKGGIALLALLLTRGLELARCDASVRPAFFLPTARRSWRSFFETASLRAPIRYCPPKLAQRKSRGDQMNVWDGRFRRHAAAGTRTMPAVIKASMASRSNPASSSTARLSAPISGAGRRSSSERPATPGVRGA